MEKRTFSVSIEPTGTNEKGETAFNVFLEGGGGAVRNGSRIDAMLLVLAALQKELDIPDDLWAATKAEIAKLG